MAIKFELDSSTWKEYLTRLDEVSASDLERIKLEVSAAISALKIERDKPYSGQNEEERENLQRVLRDINDYSIVLDVVEENLKFNKESGFECNEIKTAQQTNDLKRLLEIEVILKRFIEDVATVNKTELYRIASLRLIWIQDAISKIPNEITDLKEPKNFLRDRKFT